MANTSQEILERNLAAAGPGYVRPVDYAIMHGLTRGQVDYYISVKSLRMPDGTDGIRRVNNNYYVHKDAAVKRVYQPRAKFTFGRKALCALAALSVYNPVYAASDYVVLADGQQTVIDRTELPIINRVSGGGGKGGVEIPLQNNSFSYSLPRAESLPCPYVYTPTPVPMPTYPPLDPGFGPTLTPSVQQHIQRPLIFKQKHPVFWKTTAPWRRYIWHPMVMVGKKTGFNKVAALASDSFIKMGEVTEPYHAGGTTVNTVLGLAATCGLFLKR